MTFNPPQHFRAAIYWLAVAVFLVLLTIDVLFLLGVLEGQALGLLESLVGLITTLLAAVNTPFKPQAADEGDGTFSF